MNKLILLIFFIIIPAQVSALNLFQIGISLTNVNTTYTYTFNLTNLGPDLDEIFKWEFSNGSGVWSNHVITGPADWEGHITGGGKLMEMTNNGSGTSTRIASGETATFTWTFDLNGGSPPTTVWVGSVHFQPVNSLGENIVGVNTYKVTTPVPEPATLLLMGFGLTGSALYCRFRKKINKN